MEIILTGIIVILTGVSVWHGAKTYNDNKKSRFYWDFFVPQYMDGVFTFNGETIQLKDGRMEIENRAKNIKTYDFAQQARQNNPPTYENKLAHRLSVVLNRIGQAAFVGDLPLSYIFPISSRMIIADWEKSVSFVNFLVKDKTMSEYSALNYNRKFFRWLACASCMYIVSEGCPEIEVKKQIGMYAHNTNMKINYKECAEKMIEEIDMLQKKDESIRAVSTVRYVKKLKKKFRKRINECVF